MEVWKSRDFLAISLFLNMLHILIVFLRVSICDFAMIYKNKEPANIFSKKTLHFPASSLLILITKTGSHFRRESRHLVLKYSRFGGT